MNEKSSLGRGLSTLIPNKNPIPNSDFVAHSQTQVESPFDIPKSPQEGMELISIKVELIEPNPFQPRKEFDEQELVNLSHSIRDNGVLQPLIVIKREYDGKYELIAGERRWRASKLAGLKEVPVIIRSCVEDVKKAEWALVENIQRQDLNPIERAKSFAKMLDYFGLTQDQLAQKMDMSRSYIANTLRLLKLSSKIQQGLQAGLITEGHAKIMAGIDDESLRDRLFDKIVRYSLSVKDLSSELKNTHSKKSETQIIEPQIQAWSQDLSAKLQEQVDIKKKGKKFVMTVRFKTQEELEKFANKLT